MKKEKIVEELALAETISSLAQVVNTVIDQMVNMTKEMQTLQDSHITLCNRLNEIELNQDALANGVMKLEAKRYKKEPLVKPYIENGICVETPYPKPISKVRKVVDNLKRLVDATP